MKIQLCCFNGLVYVLSGNGTIGPERRPLAEGQLALFGGGDALTMTASDSQPIASAQGWEILLLGGLPIREPIAWYGPFAMNTRDEIIQAVEDFQAGRMGTIPVTRLPHQGGADEPLAR